MSCSSAQVVGYPFTDPIPVTSRQQHVVNSLVATGVGRLVQKSSEECRDFRRRRRFVRPGVDMQFERIGIDASEKKDSYRRVSQFRASGIEREDGEKAEDNDFFCHILKYHLNNKRTEGIKMSEMEQREGTILALVTARSSFKEAGRAERFIWNNNASQYSKSQRKYEPFEEKRFV